MASIKKRPNGTWRARYRDAAGKEHARHFKFKDNARDPENSAQHWLDTVTASIVTNTYVDPKRAKITVAEWCDEWFAGYNRRPNSVAQAKQHIARITDTLGNRQLSSIRQSDVKKWVKSLSDSGLAPSTVWAAHQRLSQIFGDAVIDGLIPRSPTSRHTAPPKGEQRPFVPTTEQIWALHDALPDGAKNIVLLGAFAGLRRNEMIALDTFEIDFIRGIITPAKQYPNEPLKTKESKNPIPIPQELALELNRVPAQWNTTKLIVHEDGRPMSKSAVNILWADTRAEVRKTMPELPTEIRIQDLRHYFASMLIRSGLDVKMVQARMRHSSAVTTLNVYGHLWPDSDDLSRRAVAGVLKERSGTLADSLRTEARTSQ